MPVEIALPGFGFDLAPFLMVDPSEPYKLKDAYSGIYKVLGIYRTQLNLDSHVAIADTLQSQPLWRYERVGEIKSGKAQATLYDIEGVEFALAKVSFPFPDNTPDKGYCYHIGDKFFALTGGGSGGSGGSGSLVRFSFPVDEYAESQIPAACAGGRVKSLEIEWRVKVDGFPCGAGTVNGIDNEGYILVSDPLGWLKGFKMGSLSGKKGYAALMAGSGYDGCGWEIVSINMFEEVVNVVDVVDTGDTIDVHFEKQRVWGHCDLPIYQIQTTDCGGYY